jgi:hypothetical protein
VLEVEVVLGEVAEEQEKVVLIEVEEHGTVVLGDVAVELPEYIKAARQQAVQSRPRPIFSRHSEHSQLISSLR